MTVEGGCDIDNVAQLQALIFLLASPFNGLAVRLLIRICIDEKEVLTEEVRVLRAFGGEFKDSDSDVWFGLRVKKCVRNRGFSRIDL